MNIVEKYYNLNDPSKKGPRGFVFAYDENGKLLFTEENMIVKTGRHALMQYGFDNENSKITKVLIGNSESVTEQDSDIDSIGTNDDSIRTINTRISDYNNENEEEYSKLKDVVTEGKYTEISKNFDIFSSLTIDHSNGSIIYYTNDSENPKKTLIHASVDISRDNNEVSLNGFDGSCFDIKENTSGNNTYALVKIFIRQSYDDVEVNSSNPATDQISCIGLCMGDTLFSRVVFPRYYKSSAQSIVFDYYIYF